MADTEQLSAPDLENKIIAAMEDIAQMLDSPLVTPLSDDTVLLQSGLDSLGFAMLVAKLEEDLGYDPFVLMTDAVYPRTLGEFTELYIRYYEQR